MAPILEKSHRHVQGRFFAESDQLGGLTFGDLFDPAVALQVSVAGFGTRWRYTQGYETFRPGRGLNGRPESGQEAFFISQVVVGSQDHHDRIGAESSFAH